MTTEDGAIDAPHEAPDGASLDCYSTPRTAQLPMAFDGWEFARGAFAAWAIFFALAQIALLGAGLLLLPIFIPFSLAALLVWMLPARGLEWMMRRQRHMAWHILAFFAFGYAIGYATMTLAFPIDGIYRHVMPLCSAVAVATGWWLSARRALAADRRQEALRRFRQSWSNRSARLRAQLRKAAPLRVRSSRIVAPPDRSS